MQNRAYRNMLSIAVILLAAFFTTSSLLPIHEDLIEVTPAQLTPAKRAAIQWVDSNRDLLASLNDQSVELCRIGLARVQVFGAAGRGAGTERLQSDTGGFRYAHRVCGRVG